MNQPDPCPFPLDHLAVRGAPSDVAIATKAEAVDYAALDLLVGRLAAALINAGLVHGDRVATWLNKTLEACVFPLAAARAGLVHVPINPALKHGQVAHILSDSGAKLLVAGEGRLGSLDPTDIPSTCSIWTEEEARERRSAADFLPISAHNPDELAAMLYTSGSTGKPKGVMLSHANMWLGAVSVAYYLQLTPQDRTLCVLPLSFDYGQNQLLSSWAAGACAVPLDYLNARDVVRAVERERITTLAGVPPLWFQLTEAEWSDAARQSLRRLTNSGGALTPSLVKSLRGLFNSSRIFAMYGLTEAFRSTYLDPELIDLNPTSIGKAIPFAEILIVDGDGFEAAANVPGELVHAGPLVAKGYWQDEERTSLRFKPAPTHAAHQGMAVWSGDTAFRDADGLLYFVGREDEMIKSSGNRISPGEIEEVAIASGLTGEAVAFGRADPRLGHAIILVVRGSATQEDALRAKFRADLPAFMQPTEIIWLAELPRNANGKLDRSGIKAAGVNERQAA